jgi:hypothetical protein
LFVGNSHPAGVAALFSRSHTFDRLQYDSLRKEEYWPSADWKLEGASAGFIYASPIHRSSGAIGDFGMTIYRGQNTAIQSHLSSCLAVLEQAADFAEVGMEFRELYDLAQRSFADLELHKYRQISLLHWRLGWKAPPMQQCRILFITYSLLSKMETKMSTQISTTFLQP